MEIRLKRKKIIYYAVMIALVFLATIWILNNDLEKQYIIFYLNMIIMIGIISKAQFSFFSLICFVANYVLINVFFVYTTGDGYGLLGNVDTINMLEINNMLLILNISIMLWVFCTPIVERERELFKKNISFSVNGCILFGIIALILNYIAFPSLTLGTADNRFEALLPGHFWNHFMIVFLILSLTRIRESLIVKVLFITNLAWPLLHAERVDVLGILIYLIIVLCIKKDVKLNGKVFFKYGILIVSLFVALSYMGEARVGRTLQMGINSIFTKMVTQNTASDVGYVLNCAIKYVDNYSYLLGKTYITYVQGLFPFLEQPYRSGAILKTLYITAGGDYILCEPYMNFGYIGVFLIPNLLLITLYLFLRKKTAYRYFLFSFLCSTVFRIVWYGLSYVETGIIYLIPISFFVAWIIEGKKPKLVDDK